MKLNGLVECTSVDAVLGSETMRMSEAKSKDLSKTIVHVTLSWINTSTATYMVAVVLSTSGLWLHVDVTDDRQTISTDG